MVTPDDKSEYDDDVDNAAVQRHLSELKKKCLRKGLQKIKTKLSDFCHSPMLPGRMKC